MTQRRHIEILKQEIWLDVLVYTRKTVRSEEKDQK